MRCDIASDNIITISKAFLPPKLRMFPARDADLHEKPRKPVKGHKLV